MQKSDQPKPKNNSKNNPKIEESLLELESIVERLQDRETNLDEAFKLFEKGVELHEKINKRMLAYEKKIKILADRLGENRGGPGSDTEEFIDFAE